jgi:hypothetical protein
MEDETVHHYIVSCPARQSQRNWHFAGLGRHSRCITKILTTGKYLTHLFDYIDKTVIEQ